MGGKRCKNHGPVFPSLVLISGGRRGIFSLTWKLAAAQVESLRTACKQPADQKKSAGIR